MSMSSSKDFLILAVSASVMFVAVMIVMLSSIQSSDRNFAAIVSAVKEIRQLQENVTATSDLRGQAFVKYLEADSEDADEELDDLRNITLATADYLNITIPNETREDHIRFENGIITFDNGTKIGLGSTFSNERIPTPKPMPNIVEQLTNLNNKVNELFMSKNASEPATHVYNATQ